MKLYPLRNLFLPSSNNFAFYSSQPGKTRICQYSVIVRLILNARQQSIKKNPIGRCATSVKLSKNISLYLDNTVKPGTAGRHYLTLWQSTADSLRLFLILNSLFSRDLSNNEIVTISADALRNLGSLTEIKLGNNKYLCDSGICQFRNWILSWVLALF